MPVFPHQHHRALNEFKTMNLSEDVFHFNPKDYPNAKVVNEK